MMQTNGPTIRRLTVILASGLVLATSMPSAQVTGPHEAFVANGRANTVTVLDTTANTMAGSIDVAAPPKDVAIGPGGDRAYVAHTGTNAISVIDTHSHAVIATVDLGEEPSSLAVSPKGDRLFALGNAGLFQVVDTTLAADPAANPIVASLPVGGNNGRIAVTPDAAKVFIVSGTVAVFDTATNALDLGASPTLPSPPGVTIIPVGVTIAPGGARAYITYVSYSFDIFGFRSDGGIAVVDTATNVLTADIPLFSQPGAVSFGADGHRAFVAIQSYWANTIYAAAFLPGRWVAAVDVDSSSVVEWIDVGSTPGGLAVTADRSSLLVTLPSSNALAVIDPATDTVKQSIPFPGGPLQIAVVPDGAPAPKATVVDAVDDNAPDPLPALQATVAVANVLANDTVGGGPAALGSVTLAFLSSTDPGVSLDSETGAVLVAAWASAGSHVLTYRICEADTPNCDVATVRLSIREAVPTLRAANDVGTSPRTGSVAIANVLANDAIDAAAASLSRLTLTTMSSTDAGLTLDASTGAVSVARGTAVGAQTLVYRICEVVRPSNCGEASAVVTVAPYAITAVADSARASSKTGGLAIVNVLANDTFAGGPARTPDVTVSLLSLSPSNKQIRLNTNGTVDVIGKSSGGTYNLTYRICESASPANCAQSTARIDLSGK